MFFLGIHGSQWWAPRSTPREGTSTFFVGLSRAARRLIFATDGSDRTGPIANSPGISRRPRPVRICRTGEHTPSAALKHTASDQPVATIAVMTSMTETFRQALQTALASRETVSIRRALTEMLERDPSKAEISAANKTARRIAEDGDAVLISLLPDQAGADAYVPTARGAGRRASNYLTVDEKIIKDLPCRVETRHREVGPEGMRLTQQKIESDPTLSALLPGWKTEPRAEKRPRLTAEAAGAS